MRTPRLALFLSRFGSLATWSQAGILNRELALYRDHAKRGLRVAIVSYGRSEEAQYLSDLRGIELLYNRWNLPPRLYEKLVPYLFFRKWSRFDLLKTNQANGSLAAWRVHRLSRTPMLVRMGYIWSEFEARGHGEESAQARFARNIEGRVWKDAAGIVVTTQRMCENICSRYPTLCSRITVIPNYVDTDRFAPNGNARDLSTLIFVGRVSKQKNLTILLEAMRRNRLNLHIVGAGEDEASLRSAFADLGERVIWHGRVPHEELPALMNQSSILVSPSLYEGHPKAVIEAMACGLLVIGAESPGIREILRHGQTGWLCTPTADALVTAIDEVRNDEALLKRVGDSARRFAVENFALPTIARLERQLIDDVCMVKR
jgi:glycosyltransferase involved in cell wall biosynthesis